MKDETSKGVQLVGPVEELSDLQWARIERGMWQRLDAETADAAMRAANDAGEADAAREALRGARHRAARRRPWLIAASAGCALAAAAAIALVAWPRGAEPVATIGGEPRPGEPARVVTRDSATTVSFADAAIEVQPHSAVLMSGSADRGATVVLESGRAGFHVAPRDHQRPFVVMAGHALVRVVGTRFEVARDGEAVSVQVKEGIVDVRFLGEVHQVTAGQEWHSQETSAPLVPVPVPAAAESEDDAADAGLPAEPAKRRHTVKQREDEGRAEAPAPAPPDEDADKDKDKDKDEDRAQAAAAQAAARARAAEFTAAAKLESSAPQQAMKQYLELAKQNDRWAQNALYAAARLALDVGQRERAAALARAYLRRFPDGPNAADARALLEALP